MRTLEAAAAADRHLRHAPHFTSRMEPMETLLLEACMHFRVSVNTFIRQLLATSLNESSSSTALVLTHSVHFPGHCLGRRRNVSHLWLHGSTCAQKLDGLAALCLMQRKLCCGTLSETFQTSRQLNTHAVAHRTRLSGSAPVLGCPCACFERFVQLSKYLLALIL